ncbi:MAG: DNA polymerase III subunit chi [Granulosicoccus sp.]
MTRVDFYVLSTQDTQDRLTLVCKLAEKAVAVGQKIFIFANNIQELEKLDALLWTFRPVSFVAHHLLDANISNVAGNDDPVHLSCGEPAIDRNLLINLDSAVPYFFSRFERTLEIVNRQPDIERAGRERYLYYKHRGYPLKHHSV